MNVKACTFERLALISLRFGRGAQVGKTSLLEVEFITAQASTLGVFTFYFGTLQSAGSHQNPRFLEEDDAFFLQCTAKIVRRHTSRLVSGVVSQQRLLVPKLRFEPIFFCLSF